MVTAKGIGRGCQSVHFMPSIVPCTQDSVLVKPDTILGLLDSVILWKTPTNK